MTNQESHVKFDKFHIFIYNYIYIFICEDSMKREKELTLHQKIHHHLRKHFHRHIHKVLHISNHLHHILFHNLELVVVCIITVTSFGFADLTWLNQNLYTNNATETAQHLLSAMENPRASLMQWNIISVWSMTMDVENTFAKWYCTYWAARVSPEFFPFSGEKTQQRTWWGNAVDRCKNAADTWYKIWLVPSQWALVVYDAGGRFWSYGHVGKVLHYDNVRKKIIVRDMARVARWTMSDRREDITTANVKCYIYNSKTSLPTVDPIPVVEPIVPVVITWTETPVIPVIITPTVLSVPVVVPPTPTPPAVVVPPTTPVVSLPTEPTHPTAPVVIPQEPVVVVPPVTPPIIPQNKVDNALVLKLDTLSEIAQHFMTQNDLVITVVSKSPLKLGEVAVLTFEIKNKKTGELYSWLLPFSFSILSTNDTLQPSISNIQMVNDWVVDVSILGQKTGTATIVIAMNDKKIGNFSLEVK